jgi:peptidoglycan/xylan/chitin deacetylase (PgdA/CDA1 family)
MALAYHGIGSASDGEGGFVVSPKRFGEHLATLKAGGMNVVTASDVDRAFRGGEPLPPNAVMLTFDDGRTDAMMFADPLLRQAGMKATMFVITDAASEPGVYYASWGRLKKYRRSGRWDIQSHTSGSHNEQRVEGGERLPALTSLASDESLDEYRDRVRADLTEAADKIESNIGHRPVALAYPFGAYGADRSNDPAIRDVLREEVGRQYALGFHQDEQDRIPLVTPSADRLGLRRLEVEGWSGAVLLQRIGDAARRSGFTVEPPLALPTVDEAPSDILELTLPAPVSAVAAPVPSAAAVSSPRPTPAPQPVPTAPPTTRGATGGSSPSTSPPATVSRTTPTTSPPSTSGPRCPDTGKPPPGCPKRGNAGQARQ